MKKILLLAAVPLFLAIYSCKKEKSYLYDVNTTNVTQPGSDKPNVKSTTEFISIAYSDLFGTGITQDKLVNLSTAYASFGDKKLIEDMIIKNFLKDPSVKIPAKTEMQTDVSKFVSDTYKKFLNREPNEYEKWYLVNLINTDTITTPEIIYYSIMTSNEYRYY